MKKCVSCLITVALLFCVAFGTVACKQPEPSVQPGITEQPGTNDGETEQPNPDPDEGDPEQPEEPTPPDPDDAPDTPTPPDPDDKDPDMPTPPDPGDKDPEPPEEPANPTITGYNCFADGFTYATPFFGDYAYVEKGAEHFWLNRQGRLTACDTDLRAATFKQNKYVVCDAVGNRKLIDISGEVLLEGAYTRIEYEGNTALAFSDGECVVFDLSDTTAEPVLLGTEDVEIVADGYLRKDGDLALYGLDGKVMNRKFPDITGNYTLITPPENDACIVRLAKSDAYYYVTSSGFVNHVPYMEMVLFTNGYSAGLDDDYIWDVYDATCKKVFSYQNPDDAYYIVVAATEQYVLLQQDPEFGDGAYYYVSLSATNQDLILLPYATLDNDILFGCVVDNTQKVVYSLAEKKIIAQEFVQAVVGADGFLIETADGWRIVQEDGTALITDIQEAVWSGEILVKIDGEYLYYEKASSSR